MIQMIRTWLVGITCAAAVVALADAIMPKGTVRKIGKSIGGLLLMVAILRPVLAFDFDGLSLALTRYRTEAEGYSAELTEENGRLMKGIIEEQTGAYIADKAAELGCSVTVDVECAVDETGFPYPTAVTVMGALDTEQRNALQRSIEADFAIPAEAQTFAAG